MLSKYLENSLKNSSYSEELNNILEYAVLPPGKLFRPKLVEALYKDLHGQDNNYVHLGTAIEFHHAYSLVHDDLPCMDNDLVRRGKPSTHAAFGEWKAVLTGDALLVKSFHELTKIYHSQCLDIFKLFSWATGAKGLICGQFLDLSSSGKNSLESTIRIHELKTARLIQVATVGSYLLYSKDQNLRYLKMFLRLGREIGVSFQLLDDLSELSDHNYSDHEANINPFLTSNRDAFLALAQSVSRLKSMLIELKLYKTSEMLGTYFLQNRTYLIQDISKICQKFKNGIQEEDFRNWIKTNLETF